MSAAMEARRKCFAEGIAQAKVDATGREQVAIEEDCPGEDFDREMAALLMVAAQMETAYTMHQIADNDQSRQLWRAEIAYCRGYLMETLLPGFQDPLPAE